MTTTHDAAAAIRKALTLDELLPIVRDLRVETVADDRLLANLPTFGGEEVTALGVFSWDYHRVLVQRASGWQIISREDL